MYKLLIKVGVGGDYNIMRWYIIATLIISSGAIRNLYRSRNYICRWSNQVMQHVFATIQFRNLFRTLPTEFKWSVNALCTGYTNINTMYVYTYKGCFVVIEFASFEDKPSSTPVLGCKTRPSHFIHPSLVVYILQLEAGDMEGWVGAFAAFFNSELRL